MFYSFQCGDVFVQVGKLTKLINRKSTAHVFRKSVSFHHKDLAMSLHLDSHLNKQYCVIWCGTYNVPILKSLFILRLSYYSRYLDHCVTQPHLDIMVYDMHTHYYGRNSANDFDMCENVISNYNIHQVGN